MRSLRQLLTGILIFGSSVAFAQVNFKKDWAAANPVQPGVAMPASNKVAIHAAYLEKAVAEKNTLHQLYGQLYLFEDQIDDQHYAAAASYLLEADKIASSSGNAAWMGDVKVRAAWLSLILHPDKKKALEQYRAALQLCTAAGDSFCIARCLEQFGVLYADAKILDSAHYYFNLAIPLIRQFTHTSLGSVYNNYSNLLAFENRSAEGLLYIDSAIVSARKEQNFRSETIYLTNKAVILAKIKRFNEAIALFNSCAIANRANGWLDDLVFDYLGLANAYSQTGNYKAAFDYKEKYHALNDSISGIAVNLTIAELSATNKNQEKELLIQQKQLELTQAKNLLAKRTWIILASGLLIAIILGGWSVNNKKNRIAQLQSKHDLNMLTRLLIEKNTALALLEQQFTVKQPETYINHTEAIKEPVEQPENQELPEENDLAAVNTHPGVNVENNDFENDIYNQRILTNEDSAAFKTYFEKAYPGYIRRLRASFNGLTEAEERLFLFIKLNLKSKESAAILGISIDSVKKTRNRLRKRLVLTEQTDLDEFIEKF